MGKLHSLRRAIEANPERWVSKFSGVAGASFHKETIHDPVCQWHPTNSWYKHRSYRAFVRSVLRDLGYPV
jgi:hypothetical protein